MNDRINELIEQLRSEVFKAWDKATNADIRIEPDGYTHFFVEQIKESDDLPVEAWKRRDVYDVWKTSIDGKWSKDRSDEQNAYYKARKLLLEDEQ